MCQRPQKTQPAGVFFIWENNYKESKKKDTNFKWNNKKTYSLILQHRNAELEGNLKGMYTYDAIETDKDSIDLSKMIRTICYLQDDNKQDAMTPVETDK